MIVTDLEVQAAREAIERAEQVLVIARRCLTPASDLDHYPEDAPSLDLCEAAGLDGSLRGLDGRPAGEFVTWKELATVATALLSEFVSCGIIEYEDLWQTQHDLRKGGVL